MIKKKTNNYYRCLIQLWPSVVIISDGTNDQNYNNNNQVVKKTTPFVVLLQFVCVNRRSSRVLKQRQQLIKERRRVCDGQAWSDIPAVMKPPPANKTSTEFPPFHRSKALPCFSAAAGCEIWLYFPSHSPSMHTNLTAPTINHGACEWACACVIVCCTASGCIYLPVLGSEGCISKLRLLFLSRVA